ncbi:MAG: tRNA (guanosine(37)-N1)-methyltransferase TrmD [Planctomycetaceae bacterium]|jgi:tRNA (guanine37-N1)-methyltransferase|nr:tRNA (guanosine(37)-N1)-methyltransferase TrmD [Planctomycetaceae bacterium]
MIRFDILTLFPSIFDGFLSESILKNAIESGKLTVQLHNMRDWAIGKHSNMDDRPFGGGPGMVLKVDCIVPCIESVREMFVETGRLIMLSPQGRHYDQKLAEEFAAEKRLILLCGRYEGIDERVVELLEPEEISIGDYILNGGEVAAMVLIESVMRLLPGVLGDLDSNKFDSFSSGNRLLDCAQYTRPREFRGLSAPDVLLNGNHAEIAQWRTENSLQRTKLRRPDLLYEIDQID